MKITISLITALLFSFSLQAASKTDTIYFYLSGMKYEKSELDHIVYAKVKRNVHVYTFTLPCKCMPEGSIGFSGHNNPEIGDNFDHVKILPSNVIKSLHFIQYTKLIGYLKAHRNSYKLYFIEKSNKIYHQYQVKMMGSFYEE